MSLKTGIYEVAVFSYRCASAIESISIAAFFYVLASNVNGQSGRRRRIAIAKLRQLLGQPLWTPVPEPT